MIKKIIKSKALEYITKISFVLAILVLIAMLGFGFPTEYKIFVNILFINILLLGIVKTVLKYTYTEEKNIHRVIVFDILSVVFISYCLYKQINDYSFFYVSKYLQFAVLLKLIREFATPNFSFKRKYINPPQLFIISFVALIFIGAFLLMLPKATNHSITFLNALFTSTSAVCVTGLSVYDVPYTFSTFGQFIIMILVQIGGLGILTFAAYIAYFFKGNSSFEYQITLGNISNNDAFSEVFSFIKRIIFLTFSIELIGAILIYISLNNLNAPITDKIFLSIFHSISAFCNAGFSILPNGFSHTIILNNYFLQSIVIVLIFLGGIGFPILVNILRYFKYFINKTVLIVFYKKQEQKTWVFNLNSKVNLVTSLTIFIITTVIIYFEEFYNVLNSHVGLGKLISAAFISMTTRTAGFNTIDFSQLQFSTIIMILLLMWVGASPTSTGGGIKTSTFAIAILNFINIARGKQSIEIYNRSINNTIVQRAFATITLSFLVIGIGIFLITKFENDLPLIDIAFEVFSAYSTVGLSLNTTPLLSDSSKIVLIVIMFIGRVSMITILTAFFKKSISSRYNYPSGDILI